MNELDDPEVLAVTSPEFADVRIDLGIARAGFAAEAAVRQTADLWSSIADVLADAERHPEVFIDPRAQLSVSERREYAVRSAAADLAVRLAVAENTVRGWGEAARRLRSDTGRVWASFREGEVSVANARPRTRVRRSRSSSSTRRHGWLLPGSVLWCGRPVNASIARRSPNGTARPPRSGELWSTTISTACRG